MGTCECERGVGRNERRDKFGNREKIKDNRKRYSDKQEVEKSKYGGKYCIRQREAEI